jgi:hypothetical protein
MSTTEEDTTEFIECLFNKFLKDKHDIGIDDTAIITLLSSLADKSHAIKLLLDAKAPATVDIIVRSFIEQFVYMAYILQAHTKDRASALFIQQRYDSYSKTERVLENISDPDLIRGLRSELDHKVQKSLGAHNSLKEGLDDYEMQFHDLFNRGRAKHHNARKDAVTGKKNKYIWYNIDWDTTNTFFDLCEKVGARDLYESFYQTYSMGVHGTSAPANLLIDRMIDIDSNIADVKLVAGMGDESSLRLVRSLLMSSTIKVADYYHVDKSKLPNVFKKYQLNVILNNN